MRPTNSWNVRCTSDSSRISALQRFDEKCHYRTYASQQIARFQGPHPQTDSEMGMQAAARIHSISRSARSMIDCGIERLSAVAVFMLINISNLVGCSTGILMVWGPLKIMSLYSAARW